MERGDTLFDVACSRGDGRLALTLILNRWIGLRAADFDANPGDRLAYREMCFALHKTTGAVAALPEISGSGT